MLKLGEVGSAIQQMVNAAQKVLKAAGKAGIVPTERKARVAKKPKSKPAAKPADNEGDDE
jgi:hypothetical protein